MYTFSIKFYGIARFDFQSLPIVHIPIPSNQSGGYDSLSFPAVLHPVKRFEQLNQLNIST